jgi:hypothetical protein
MVLRRRAEMKPAEGRVAAAAPSTMVFSSTRSKD